MQKYFLTVILLIGFGLLPASGQTIKFELPAQKGKTLYLIANKGILQDTIFSGQISEKGDLVFTPNKDKPLSSGVLLLLIQPDIKSILIYSSTENMTFHSEGENLNNQNLQIKNSPENDFIMASFPDQMRLQEKIMFCDQGERMYNENDNFFKALTKEKKSLEKQRIIFESMLQKQSTKLYSARLMQIHNLMNNYVNRLQITTDITEKVRIKDYVYSHLDVEALYSSGMWGNFINGILGLYHKESSFFGQFGNDMAKLLQRTESQEVFNALTNDAASICSQFGWNTDEIALSKYLIQSDRITNPQGLLRKMLMQYRFEPGMLAPKIKVKENQYIDFQKSTTLIVFYETGCTICDNEMNQLTDNYKVLKEKGIEVVSIAADHDRDTFENSSKNFPWSEKLCDFNGFSGENFSNYAIIGAPTLYMIDKDGIILGKYASVSEIIEQKNK